ncbi:MAG TPA: MBL fold metallo-hydrolase [Gammaproteobacteria bacterium]|nr:MBL fold metallo-hydrolase [Gammaproteobacteria bacterium]
MKAQFAASWCAALLVGLGLSAAHAEDVIITPLGAVEGEFCALDRAMIFEDPSGVRILIQPGRTVSGSDDPRLGDVHVILLGHVHGDHIGDEIDIGCDGSGGTSLAPTGIPNIAEIAAGKNSAMLVGGETVFWLQERTSAALGAAVGGCGASGLTNLTEVSRTTPCADTLRPGASRELQLDGIPTGVHVSTVAVPHSNGIPAPFVNGAVPFGLTGYSGTESGYVIRFSNGLSVFWTSDSGFFGDMRLISRFYHVNLAVVHIGDIFTMGPDEAAFAVNRLIKPRTAIAQHANEIATTGGVVNPGTRTERFIQRSRKPVIVPLSGVPIYCDGHGNCTQ